MSSSFWNGEFYYDGTYSNLLNVCIVDFDSNEMLKQIGVNATIDLAEESTFNGNKSYIENNRDSADNIILQLCRTDGQAWNEGSITNVYSWLFKKDFKKFQTLDYPGNYNLCYYLKAVSFKKVLNPDFHGYLEVEFKSYSPYCYSIPNNSPTLSNGETKVITNYSNLYEPYKPKIKISNRGASNIRITNRSNGSFVEVAGLNSGEVIIVDCAMGTVMNSNGDNRFEVLQDYNLLGLEKGDNSINLSGSASVEFICEFPMII